MISKNLITFTTRWKKYNPNYFKYYISRASVILLLTTLVISQSFSTANELTTEQQSTNFKLNNSLCPKTWNYLSNKCYKIFLNPRNLETAKSRCSELGAQLAVIGDESSKEKESPINGTTYTTIITQLSTDPRKIDFQTRFFYINISSSLQEQYQERYQNGYYNETLNVEYLETELPMSELWIPKDEPKFFEIFGNISEKQDYAAFALAYSRYRNRWGIVPVPPTRKMSFICERSIGAQSSLSSQPNKNQQQNNQTQANSQQNNNNEYSRRNSDLNNGQAYNSISINSAQPSSSSTNQDLNKVREVGPTTTTTTPQPEATSMLFREFPQDQSIILGSTAEMRCSSLESESTLNWNFNSKNLTQTNRVKVYSNGTLRIDHVRNTDDGNYTCTISSGNIIESKSARLEIIERPHQPEYITAELLDKLSPSVRIKWVPGFNGNSPIIKYMVEMKTINNDNNYDKDLNLGSNWEVAKVNISASATSVIINDLKPARKYIFRIRATNRVGTSEPSLPTRQPIEVPVQPPSMPPENLIGTPKSSTSIALQWSPPPVDSQNGIIKGYKVRHKLAGYASDTNWYTNDITDSSRLTFVLDDLIVWQNYEIQVAAENDKDVGPYSSSIFVRTKEGKPDKGPRSVNAEALSSSSLKVNWNPPLPQHINGINQGYRVSAWLDIHQSQLAKELIVPHNTESPFHSAILDGLIPYTEYFISVRCFTNAGDGPPNEEVVKIKTKQDIPEAVPKLEFADVLDQSLRIIWKPPIRVNGELVHYTLEYSETSTLDKKTQKTYPATVTEARIIGLTPQTSYTFKLYAHTSVGQGQGRTNQTSTSVPPVLPEPPSNLVFSNIEPNSVTINFDPGFDGNASIERWIVEAQLQTRAEYMPHKWHIIYVSTNHTQKNSIVVRNLKPFTHYKIRLIPVNIVGQSRYPSEPTHEFQTSQIEPEQPPKDLSIHDIKSTSIVAHWTPLSSSLWQGIPVGYNLTWSETNNPSYVMYQLINDSLASSYLVKDLEEYTEYSFKVSGVNEAGSSPSSEQVIITTLEDVPSSGPTNFTVHALSYNAISVDWNSVPKKHRNGIIKGYKIQYQAFRLDAPLQIKTVDDNTTRHVTLNDLKAYTIYHIAVAAYTSLGDGVYTNVLDVQTLEDTPSSPQNLSFPTVSQTTVRVLWDPPSDPNGEILGYKVSYHSLYDGNKEVSSHELHQNERTFKATNLKPKTHYVFTVTAKTKEGWGQQANMLIYTSESDGNLPIYKESWFTILVGAVMTVIIICVVAYLYVETKSYKYKQEVIKSTSHDRLGDAGFSIDYEANGHYNNGFGLLTHSNANHRRSNGALSQSTANFTLPKTPPRPLPGSVIYSDEGDDDVFEDIVDKQTRSNGVGVPSNYDSSDDSLTEKPSEISSSTAPDSESADDEYVNMANKHFVNHYANVNGTLRGQKVWKKNAKHYSSSSHGRPTKPKLPQRPAPSVPHVPGEQNSSGSDNAGNPIPGTSGLQSIRQQPPPSTSSIYGESSSIYHKQQQPDGGLRNANNLSKGIGNCDAVDGSVEKSNTQQADLLNGQIVNLNGGRIIVDNMAGSRAPLPGFTSFV